MQEAENRLNVEAVQSIIEKLRSTNQLTNADRLHISLLESELKAGKQIQDVETTIRDLKIQGVTSLNLILMSALSDLKIAKDKAKEEKRYTIERQKNVLLAESELNTQNLILQTVSNRLDRARRENDIFLESGPDLAIAKNQSEILRLREQIASQPFATPEQEAQLARLNVINRAI